MSPEALYNLGTWNYALATAWDPVGGKGLQRFAKSENPCIQSQKPQ